MKKSRLFGGIGFQPMQHALTVPCTKNRIFGARVHGLEAHATKELTSFLDRLSSGSEESPRPPATEFPFTCWRTRARRLAASASLAAATMLGLACATTADTGDTDSAPTAQPLRLAKSRDREPKIEFTAPRTSLALVLRELSTKTRRSIVLMNGVELTTTVGPYDSKKFSARHWIDRIAEDAGIRIEHASGYDFFYPAGYEVLNSGSIAPRLDPALAARRTSLHFDVDTPLYSALALLSHSLRTTIVADNIVADARCGEVHLYDVTLADALDALLRSARIADRAYEVKGGADSVFLYSPGRPLREKTLVEVADEVRPEWLDRRVTLYLPAAPAEPAHLRGYASAVPLGDCLAELSRQTGLRVEADPRMNALPVNPSVMVDVPIQTALDLIINQWPLPHFGYRANADTVRFVYLGPPIEK